jgi:hypothetical protein
MFQGVELSWDSLSVFCVSQNATWVKSRKRCFKGWNYTANSFPAFWTAQKVTWALLRKRCLLIGPKCDLGDVQKAIIQVVLTTLFISSGRPKMRLGWIRENDVSRGRMVLRLICLLCVPKCDWGEVEKAMFQEVELHCELISCLPIRPKSDLVVVEKATFQLVALACEHIFCLIAVPKSDEQGR